MKYRLAEILKCPEHPESMLRITGPQISDVFPFAGEIQVPVCRRGCGLLGNWFADIPASLPVHHRFDCRRCLGTEIEGGRLICPECDWGFDIIDGILDTAGSLGNIEDKFEIAIKSRNSSHVEKILALKPGDLVLEFETVPDSLTGSWCSIGVEQIKVEKDLKSATDCRARCCAKGFGTVYHFRAPLKVDFLRENSFDAIILALPSVRLHEFENSIGGILPLLRPSGQSLILRTRKRGDRRSLSERHDAILESLPEDFKAFRTSMTESREFDFLHLEHPEPENGSVIHKIDAFKLNDEIPPIR